MDSHVRPLSYEPEVHGDRQVAQVEAKVVNVQAVQTDNGIRLSNDHGALFISVSDGQAVIHDLVGDGQDGSTVTELVAEAERVLRKAGFDEVLIHVSSDQPRLVDLYVKRWGMEPVAVILRKVLD